jgi:hypothetical protein
MMRCYVVALSVVIHGSALGAQSIPRITRPPAVDRLAHEFGEVLSIRAFGDSAMLVSDRFPSTLMRGDWRSGRTMEVGRSGQGPGEYETPGIIIALSGDTSLLTDLRNGRWSWFDGTTFVRHATRANPGPRTIGPLVYGASRAGAVLGTRGVTNRSAQGTKRRMFATYPEFADSQLVLRVSLAAGSIDTVATVRGGYAGEPNEIVRNVNGVDVTYILRSALATQEQAVLLVDGWIALVLLEPFRVDWIDPGGKRHRGAPLPIERVAVSAAEKRFTLERLVSSGSLRWRDSDYPHWPAYVPAFLTRSVLPLPSGQIAIRRRQNGRTHAT